VDATLQSVVSYISALSRDDSVTKVVECYLCSGGAFRRCVQLFRLQQQKHRLRSTLSESESMFPESKTGGPLDNVALAYDFHANHALAPGAHLAE